MLKITVKGRPASGKTTLICRMAAALSKDGIPVAIVNTEDPPETIRQKLAYDGAKLELVAIAETEAAAVSYGPAAVFAEQQEMKTAVTGHPTCTGTTAAGNPCGRRPMVGIDRCLSHATREQRRIAYGE